MREIKFRAWDITNSTMVDWGDLQQRGFGIFKNRYLMQFTGLKDKNGKEIYENDVIKFDMKEDGVDTYVIQYAVFEMRMPKFWARARGLKAREIWGGGDYEVIGNIYENPELLESGGN